MQGPGDAADALIDRESGRYDVTLSYHGLIVIVDDLHKGGDTGPSWSVVIDLSAVFVGAWGLVGRRRGR